MNRQEAKIESQKAEMRPSKRFRFNTGPLNNWYEVNLNSIQGVHVDDSISTSISSVSRVTEPAISHPAQAGSDPELSQPKEHQCRKQYQCRLQLLVRHQRTIRKFHWQYLHSSIPTTSPLIQSTDSTVTVADHGGPKEMKKPRQLLLTNSLNQQNLEVGKILSKAKSLMLRNIPETLCYG